jgi:cation diffusion facilitator CzcD-associated flavoprotein CzcO
MSTPVRVAVVGAGLGGIATAVKLKRAGIESFTVFERAGGPGGVWWQNTYPGCEVDIPSHAYSFSFMPYDWSGTHAKQPELQRYAEDVIDRFEVRGHFRFGVGVRSAVWDENRNLYVLELADGSTSEAELLVSAVGMLSDPKMPDWPGLDTFDGPVFHTSRFEHRHVLEGKRVALVGTGSSACQLGPAIAPVVGKLDVYQREPGHVLPKRDRAFDPVERARFRRFAALQRIERLKLFRLGRKTADALQTGSANHRRVESIYRRYLEKTVPDPAAREALTPSYPYGCKRPVYASSWYPMFGRDNVELIPHAVSEVTPGGLIDATGTARPADVLILSTGFEASNYLASLPIRGAHRRWLSEAWGGEPWAFLGMTVPGFPNFAMMYGPNTNGGFSVMTQHEIQADVVVRLARRLARGRVTVIDTRYRLAERVDRWVQDQITLTMSSLAGGCHNYYHSAQGKNVTQWPRSHSAYRLATRLLLPRGLKAMAAQRLSTAVTTTPRS